jgi:hypothetical protein
LMVKYEATALASNSTSEIVKPVDNPRFDVCFILIVDS